MVDFVILDGNSLLNRAYYAINKTMITSDGLFTQGIYGFLLMLGKILSDYDPAYITVCFDRKAPTFRHLEYDEYKAGRKPMPMELAMEFEPLKEVLGAMNISIVEMDGYEADDLIGTLAKRGEAEGLTPLIITGDKDALQLISDKTSVLITKKGITDYDLWDTDKMLETYGFEPKVFIDLKGLMGDNSDNLPGIPGVGEKKGLALLEKYGSLENTLDNADEIPGKLGENVRDNKQSALMSKRLATIITDAPIEDDIGSMSYRQPDTEKLAEIYRKLEFNSFLKKMDRPQTVRWTSDTHVSGISESNNAGKELVQGKITRSDMPVAYITSAEEMKRLVAAAEAAGEFALKCFGDNNHRAKPIIYGIGIMVNHASYYIDISDFVPDPDDIKSLFSQNGLIGHNLKDDLYMLCSISCFELRSIHIIHDTAIAEYLIDPAASDYSLDKLALKYCAESIPEEKDVISAGTQTDMFGENSEVYANYAKTLLETLCAVCEAQTKQIDILKLRDVYEMAELTLIKVLTDMEYEGFPFDENELKATDTEIRSRLETLTKDIYALTGVEFNINSPKQLGTILFEDMKLPFAKKTKSGYATGAEVLEKLKDVHPIASKILEFRMLSKLKGTYIDGLIPLKAPDGRVHAHFRQTVTATGRLSCTEPNLQNIPIRQEFGRLIRKAFVSGDDEYTLVGADYSQIELRILAHFSGDEALINDFIRGEDIHRRTAARVFDVDDANVSLSQRSAAKAVNFGIIYGMSSFGLSEELGISRKEAESFIESYFLRHPAVKAYLDSCVKKAKEKGYTETLLGRTRRIPEIGASNYMLRQAGERLAMNTPVQGSAADIMKLAMIAVWNALNNSKIDAKIILQVHDELILLTRKRDADQAAALLKEEMENAYMLKVPLIADVNVSDNWYDLK